MINSLKKALGFVSYAMPEPPYNPIECMGLIFPNKVGVAAGFDKNGEHIETLDRLGFGHVEVGTVTIEDRVGNKKPRLSKGRDFIYNNMGLPNIGFHKVLERIKKVKNKKALIGLSINADCTSGYQYMIDKAQNFVDYIIINHNCPNVTAIQRLESILAELYIERCPLLAKISPTQKIRDCSMLDGIVTCNTFRGISGEPLKRIAEDTMKDYLVGNPGLGIIASGGIMTEQDAIDRLTQGASLIQLYSGFVFNGLPLVYKCSRL